MGQNVITGVIHVHTTDSDGTKTHEEIAVIAREARLDFIIFADHMTLQSLHDGRERFYDGVLALIGYEHNDTDDCNHYLIFDNDEVFPATWAAAEYVTAAADKGAIGIMAHPDEIRGRDARFRSYPWTDWSVTRFDGIEIWNQMSEWMENLKFYNQLRMVFSPRKFLRSPTDRILRKWDELTSKRKVVGIASVDAHGFLYRAGPLKLTIFPYKVQFKTLRSHLVLPEPLSKDFITAKKQVYGAIREGRVFMSNYRWGDAGQFSFDISNAEESVIMGGTIRLDSKTKARISAPTKRKIKIIHNGNPLFESQSREIEFNLSKTGTYRVEVYRGRKGWIFTNHIRVIS
ncbi:MAG: histidinol-phosphatase [candidate division Zixibacteria bacterium]